MYKALINEGRSPEDARTKLEEDLLKYITESTLLRNLPSECKNEEKAKAGIESGRVRNMRTEHEETEEDLLDYVSERTLLRNLPDEAKELEKTRHDHHDNMSSHPHKASDMMSDEIKEVSSDGILPEEVKHLEKVREQSADKLSAKQHEEIKEVSSDGSKSRKEDDMLSSSQRKEVIQSDGTVTHISIVTCCHENKNIVKQEAGLTPKSADMVSAEQHEETEEVSFYRHVVGSLRFSTQISHTITPNSSHSLFLTLSAVSVSALLNSF